MIHQWLFEVLGERETRRTAHGRAFADKANEIGAKLGLQAVRPARSRKQKYLPTCAHWPVRLSTSLPSPPVEALGKERAGS